MTFTSVPMKSMFPTWEQSYPVLFGALSCAGWLCVGHNIASYSSAHEWHFDQLYVAFFGFASITTGFLATFYGTIQSISSGFIERIRSTSKLSGFLTLCKHAIVMGFLACVATVPMLIVQPIPVKQLSFGAFSVALWLGVAVWAIAGFWRVASFLFLLFETSGENNRPAG